MKSFRSHLHALNSWLPSLLVAGLFTTALFPLDKVFINSLSFNLGQYSDFTTYRLYAFDIVLLIAAVYIVFSNITGSPRGENSQSKTENISPRAQKLISPRGGTLIALIVLYHAVGSNLTTWWGIYEIGISIRQILVTIISYWLFSVSHETIKIKFLKILSLSLLITEGFIAIIQFIKQKSIGLSIIGEPAISGTSYDVAKIVSHGTVWLRSYGTFPHPNILGLVSAIIAILVLYKLLKSRSLTTWWTIGLLAGCLVLATTVSRSATLALAIGVGVMLCFMFHMKHETSRLSKIKVLTLLGIITFPFLLLNEVWFVPLANRESAITERVELNQAGEKMFKDSPWFGVGNGQSVFHMKQYLPTNTPTWNIQPIHNVWLLLIVEKGLLGLLISLSILYLFFRNILKKLQNPEVVLWLSIGSMLFVVSLFDHYLWTLLQGQIMLWAWVGWGLAIYDMQSQPELS